MDSDDDVSMNMSVGNVSGMRMEDSMEDSMDAQSFLTSNTPQQVGQQQQRRLFANRSGNVLDNDDMNMSGFIHRPPALVDSDADLTHASVLDTSIAFSIGPDHSFADVIALSIPDLPSPAAQHEELLAMAYRCQRRGLLQTSKWLLELVSSLPFAEEETAEIPVNSDTIDLPPDEMVIYLLAKTYFDMKEFQRAAHTLRNCSSPCALFLKLYSKYLAGERMREEQEPDPIKEPKRNANPEIDGVRKELKQLLAKGMKDPFLFYLMGLVLRDLGLELKAKDVFIAAVAAEPLLWCGWVELTSLCSNKSQVNDLCSVVPVHWIRHHFHAYAALELYAQEAISMFETLHSSYPSSSWLAASCALAHYNVRDYETAGNVFTQLRTMEPFRLENVDAYSNILYVQENKETQLSQLAHDVMKVDKYRAETCCVLGNYYSCKGVHEKAIVYFQRALQLNRKYLSAWTLLGHEYLEAKNTTAAVAAYRKAVDVNQRDYRAWYGLGQAYELMKVSLFSVYYFKRALQLRPYDTRMWEAVATALQSHNRYDEAIRCFENLRALEEGEGADTRNVISTLAVLYNKTNQNDKARKCYEDVIERDESGKIVVTDHVTLEACTFLSTYYLNKGDKSRANVYANTLVTAGEKYTHHGQRVLSQLENESNKSPTPEHAFFGQNEEWRLHHMYESMYPVSSEDGDRNRNESDVVINEDDNDFQLDLSDSD
eukprot:m.8292 g.8292  ORF g.8292 m.8292 type:complete len:713 (-) comp6067_c0_seq2:216-2354(-)